jgi:hypothetical protein
VPSSLAGLELFLRAEEDQEEMVRAKEKAARVTEMKLGDNQTRNNRISAIHRKMHCRVTEILHTVVNYSKYLGCQCMAVPALQVLMHLLHNTGRPVEPALV